MSSPTIPSSRKRPVPAPEASLGGLYDFLPPPDPERDAAAKVKAAKKDRVKLPPEDRSRVVFLDIDGVLLAAGSVETIFVDGVALPIRERMTENDFNSAAIENLRSILVRTGATLVLSSEWRRTASMRDSIGATLRSKECPQLRDCTPLLKPRPDLEKCDSAIVWCERRAREIGAWLKQHPEVTSYVAIDDLDFNWADSVRASGTPQMKVRSVQTHPQHCITEADVEKAIRILLDAPVLTEVEASLATQEAIRLTQKALDTAPLMK
mmetsp:Transcript_52564/g.151544  ORF Transcript_52564/g.151544 Transcript_52564/m.151544 type:complete len:266 (-) Transcript_52564:50-847(-)